MIQMTCAFKSEVGRINAQPSSARSKDFFISDNLELQTYVYYLKIQKVRKPGNALF